MTMPDNDTLIKIGAVSVAAWLLLAPYFKQILGLTTGLLKSLPKPSLPQPSPQPAVGTLDDMKAIVEMANRLRLAGNKAAVDACQELLDLMLHGEQK